MQEKRNIERFELEILTKVQPCDAGRDFIIAKEYITSNISASGMYFYTNDSLPINTDLFIELYIPVKYNKENIDTKTTTVKLDGFVQRLDDRGMAVSFNENYKILSTAE